MIQPVYPIQDALYTVFIIQMVLRDLRDFTQAVRMPPAADTAHVAKFHVLPNQAAIGSARPRLRRAEAEHGRTRFSH